MNSLKDLHQNSPLILGNTKKTLWFWKDVDVHEDVEAVDELATTKRLHKSGEKLRSFQVKFFKPKYYQITIVNGIKPT